MTPAVDPQTTAAVAHCRTLARAHYENFPVASWLLPRRLRDPVAVIYAFARHADDIADEGDQPRKARLDALESLRHGLVRCVSAGAPPAEPDDPILIALGAVIRRHQLPLQAFHDLLDAFSQDVTVSEYADFGTLMGYCRRSANPVGRLLLHLAGHADVRNCALSDAVCSALQLINFLQDLRGDLEARGRCYIPLDEMHRFGVTREMLLERPARPQARALIAFELDRARRLLAAGTELGRRVPGRFGLEIRAIIAGGERICLRLAGRTDILARPTLSLRDRLAIFTHALRRRWP